jgi:PAS domain S-box-containing protein
MAPAPIEQFVVLLLVASGVLLGSGLTVVAWNRRETPAARAYLGFLITSTIWCGLWFGVVLAPPTTLAVHLELLASSLAIIVVCHWVWFTIVYTGYRDRLIWWMHLLLWGLPLVFALGYLSNPLHGRFRAASPKQWGALTLVHRTHYAPLDVVEIYTVALVLLGFVLLGRFYMQTRNVYRKQTGVIILGTLAIAVAFAFYRAGFTLDPDLNLSPVFFVFFAAAVGLGLFRYDFLTVSPIAVERFIEEMEDPLLVIDTDGSILDHNTAAAAALPGLDGDTDDRGQLEAIAPALKKAVDDYQGTVTLTAPDGRQVTHDLTITPIADHHGVHRGTLLVMRDITHHRERKRQLERQNEHLEKFSSMVSHDLRNPLSTAKGYAEIAREREDFDALEESLEAMDEMEALIEELLTLARKGRTVEDPEPVNLPTQAELAWESAVTAETTLSITSEAAVDIEADPERFRELLGNLYRNTVEHALLAEADLPADHDGTPQDILDSPAFDGTDSVTVTVGRLARGEGFYVADDGPGIPEDQREEVLESGFTTSSQGTGLGLSIVTQIAQAHGWSVTVAESDAGGARFEFSNVRIRESTELESPNEAET